MKKSYLRLLYLPLAAALTACSSDLATEQQNPIFGMTGDDEPVPVAFSVSAQHTGDFTRSTESIVTFTSGEAVKVCVSTDGGSSYTGYDFTAAATGQNVNLNAPAGDKPYFPAGTATTVQAYAYYPATAASAATFSVADDQTSDANCKASDLMYAAVRTITKGSDAGTNLQMSHLMAQLHLNVTGVGLTVNRVLVNAKRSVTFTPSDGTATATGTASDIVAATAAGDAYVCIPVQPINTVTIKVETGSAGDNATTATFTFTSANDFAAGKSYPINLTVNATSLGTTTAISDWNGQQSVTYAPTGDLTIDPISEVTYNGSAYTPTLVVKKGDTTLTKDAANGYTCQWFNNTDAGTAVVLVLGQGTYAGSVAVGKFTINKADATYTAPSAKTGLTYTGSAQALANAGTSGHGTFAYCATQNGTYTTTIPTGTNAGSSYAVYWKLTGDSNHNDASGSLTGISIAKATPSVTAPTAKPSLLYTGSALELINAGSTTAGCTMQYRLDGSSTWSSDAASIKGTAAQEYTVFYKVVGNDNYNDVAQQSITASIVVFPIMTSATASDVGKVICSNGHIHTNVSDVTCGGTASGMLAYVGSSTGNSTYQHGLVIALSDANSTYAKWSTQNGKCNSYSTARPSASSSWAMPSKAQWEQMIAASSYANLRDMKGKQSSSCGGTAMHSGNYWSSTVNSGSDYWGVHLRNGSWGYGDAANLNYARAVLAF